MRSGLAGGGQMYSHPITIILSRNEIVYLTAPHSLKMLTSVLVKKMSNNIKLRMINIYRTYLFQITRNLQFFNTKSFCIVRSQKSKDSLFLSDDYNLGYFPHSSLYPSLLYPTLHYYPILQNSLPCLHDSLPPRHFCSLSVLSMRHTKTDSRLSFTWNVRTTMYAPVLPIAVKPLFRSYYVDKLYTTVRIKYLATSVEAICTVRQYV